MLFLPQNAGAIYSKTCLGGSVLPTPPRQTYTFVVFFISSLLLCWLEAATARHNNEKQISRGDCAFFHQHSSERLIVPVHERRQLVGKDRFPALSVNDAISHLLFSPRRPTSRTLQVTFKHLLQISPSVSHPRNELNENGCCLVSFFGGGNEDGAHASSS